MKKQALTFLLIAALLSVSCGTETVKPDDGTTGGTTPEVTTVPEGDGLPEMKMDGWEMRVLNYTEDSLSWVNTRIIVEEQSGDVLDDAIYERNTSLEERFDFRIVTDEVGQFDVSAAVAKNVLAGDDSYDIYVMSEGMSASYLPYTLDWHNIPYLSLDKAWWNPAATSVYEFGGKQTALAGNMTLAAASRAVCTVFNKRIWNELGDSSVDLYQLVRDGKWTLDRFIEYSKTVNKDMNGDTVWDEKDVYGMFMGRGFKGYIASFLCASGMNFTEKNADGLDEFTLYKNEKALDLMKKLVDAWSEGDGYTYYEGGVHGPSISMFFENGHALFSQRVPNDVYKLRTMEDDIGILPMPKYDEEQESYCSAAWGGAVWTLPKTFDMNKEDNLGTVLEAMSYYGYKDVIPVYKEVALKTKTARDDESSDMLDIVFSTIYFDFGTNIMYDAVIAESFLKDIFNSKSADTIVSSMEKARPEIEKYIADIFEMAAEME